MHRSSIPLKYLSNLRRSLDLLLFTCETELDLRWPRNCVIFEISRTAAVAGNPDANPPVQPLDAIET